MGMKLDKAYEADLLKRATTVGPTAKFPNATPVMPPEGAVSFNLPWPPTVNTYWRSLVIKGRVRVVLSKKGRAYREVVESLFILPTCFGSHRLAVHIFAMPPDSRIRDLDNALKAVLDSMKHAGLFDDDSQIDDLHIVRRPPTPGGSVLVTVRVIQ